MSQQPEPRWYCLSIDGAATLCVDQADAVETALGARKPSRRNASHRMGC